VRIAVIAEKRCHLTVCDEHDVTAVTAVAAVGTRQWLELLSLDGDAPVSAVTGTEVERHSVDKRGHARSSIQWSDNSVVKRRSDSDPPPKTRMGEPKLAHPQK
jgi:hypothetical protein